MTNLHHSPRPGAPSLDSDIGPAGFAIEQGSGGVQGGGELVQRLGQLFEQPGQGADGAVDVGGIRQRAGHWRWRR
ncbi:hypothetical protein ACFWJ4_15525 [Kitasatospora sp. NPDC127067]|uniref:hypothetical protein n=1 Tax=Kitasatospora sp. NPDC127067 TaxID=3347126 RepID=UPI00364C0862